MTNTNTPLSPPNESTLLESIFGNKWKNNATLIDVYRSIANKEGTFKYRTNLIQKSDLPIEIQAKLLQINGGLTYSEHKNNPPPDSHTSQLVSILRARIQEIKGEL